MNRKKIVLAALTLLFASLTTFAEVTVKITAPSVTFTSSPDPAITSQLNTLFTSDKLQQQLSGMQTQAEELLSPYSDMQLMAKGFADANLASAQSATMQGYQGYKLFAVTSGMMIGGQTPSLNSTELMQLSEAIQGDPSKITKLNFGIAPSIAYLNVGINAGKLVGIFSPDVGNMLKNLYFNVKFGIVNYNYSMGTSSIALNNTNFGFGLNYQLLAHSPSILGGLFMWRGINLGTGINYQLNDIKYGMTFKTITQDYSTTVSYSGYSATAKAVMSFTPETSLGINVSTFSIPLDVTTSAQLLWLANINLGVGADLVFGSSNINITGKSNIKVDSVTINDSKADATTTDGSVTLDASTKNVEPTLFRPRVSAGLGLNLGPVKVDLPVYYYFDYGFAAGVSLGFVW
jgi:hypothetical protein